MNRLMNRRAFIRGPGIWSADWSVRGWTAPLSPFPCLLPFQTTETQEPHGAFVTLTLLILREQPRPSGAAFQRLET
jgi:hypothetical protein